MKAMCLTCSQIPWRTEAAAHRFRAVGLDVEMFDGIHGATVGIAPTLNHFDSPTHNIGSGKLAITLSKLLLWTVCLERGYDEVLLLENDAVPCENFGERFAAAYNDLPDDWQVCHAGHSCVEDKPTRRITGNVSEIRHPYSCHAVLWKRAALELAVAEFKKASWGSMSDLMLARIVYPKLRHYSFTPPLFDTDKTPSEAGSVGRWSDLDGWFDYARLYDDQISAAVDHVRTFVEVGCWHGRSTAYMAEEIKRRMAPVEFWAVDTWKGTGCLAESVTKDHGGDLFPRFQRNMSRAGVLDYIRPLQIPSVDAARKFADGSVDFVFIDADHSYESVKADIAAWLPKVRKGCTIAGHDIDFPEIRRAVDEAFPGKWRQWERCWIVDRV